MRAGVEKDEREWELEGHGDLRGLCPPQSPIAVRLQHCRFVFVCVCFSRVEVSLADPSGGSFNHLSSMFPVRLLA